MADILVAMTSPDGVTLATAGKYCPENIRVTPPSAASSVKQWETVAAIDFLTSGVFDLLSGDAWLAQHYADDNLVVAFYRTGTTADRAIVCGIKGNAVLENQNTQGFISYGVTQARNNGSAVYSHNTPLKTPSADLRSFWATEDGDLKIKSTAAYAILAGVYSIVAWLT